MNAILSMSSKYSDEQKLLITQGSDFNLGSPHIQIIAENYFVNSICTSSDLLNGNVEEVSDHLHQASQNYGVVLRNIVFKHCLDKWMSPTEMEGRLLGALYKLFKFKKNKKHFFEVFLLMGYSREQIRNVLNLSKSMYVRHIQPPYWMKVIMGLGDMLSGWLMIELIIDLAKLIGFVISVIRT